MALGVFRDTQNITALRALMGLTAFRRLKTFTTLRALGPLEALVACRALG